MGGKEMSRAKTKEEVRKEFINKVNSIVEYWSDECVGNCDPSKDAAEGVAFSIMTLIDGCTELPSFDLIPCPHPEDKQYNIDNGNDWYESEIINADVMLHEQLRLIKKGQCST